MIFFHQILKLTLRYPSLVSIKVKTLIVICNSLFVNFCKQTNTQILVNKRPTHTQFDCTVKSVSDDISKSYVKVYE